MKKRIISILIIILAVFIVCITGIAIDIYTYGNIDEKQKCDVIIVLGASADKNGVSPVYQERINHGIWLYNNKFADYIILTGGIGENNDFSDASKAKEYVLSKGVPESSIIMEEKSTITQENLKNSKDIMDEYNFDTCIIVSDPLHMKRAMVIAEDYGMNAFSSPTPTTKYISLETKIPFLAREEFFYIGYKIYRLLCG